MSANLLQKNIPLGWTVNKLGDTNVFSINPEQIDPLKTPDVFYGYVDIGAINENSILEAKKIIGKDAPSRARRLVKEGDIIISTVRPNLRAISFISQKYSDFLVSTGFCVLRVNTNYADKDFIYQTILTDHFTNFLVKRAKGSNYPSVTYSDISDYQIVLPALNEQKKIAKILSSLDEGIRKVYSIISETEKLKIGLMQSFFNNNYPNVISIGEVSEVCTGGTPKTSEKSYWGGDIKWMSSGEVNLKRVTDTEKRITQTGLDNSNARILPVGTLMVALAGQGKTRGKVALLETETTCNQSLAAIITNPKKMDNEFLFYNLEFRYQELRDISGGEGRAGLNLKIIKDIEVPIPHIQEQKYIANILKTFDEKIFVAEKLKERFVELKKGLMSDLLSGKVRVN